MDSAKLKVTPVEGGWRVQTERSSFLVVSPSTDNNCMPAAVPSSVNREQFGCPGGGGCSAGQQRRASIVQPSTGYENAAQLGYQNASGYSNSQGTGYQNATSGIAPSVVTSASQNWLPGTMSASQNVWTTPTTSEVGQTTESTTPEILPDASDVARDLIEREWKELGDCIRSKEARGREPAAGTRESKVWNLFRKYDQQLHAQLWNALPEQVKTELIKNFMLYASKPVQKWLSDAGDAFEQVAPEFAFCQSSPFCINFDMTPCNEKVAARAKPKRSGY